MKNKPPAFTGKSNRLFKKLTLNVAQSHLILCLSAKPLLNVKLCMRLSRDTMPIPPRLKNLSLPLHCWTLALPIRQQGQGWEKEEERWNSK